jgi:hypothetical protein
MQKAGLTHRGSGAAWTHAISASLASSTPAKASKASRWFCSATRNRADPSCVLVLASGELGDEEVEQLAPGGQVSRCS